MIAGIFHERGASENSPSKNRFRTCTSEHRLQLSKGDFARLHLQVKPALEAKLVRCTRGALFDVVVDLRRESPSCFKWYGVELRAGSSQMLYIPKVVRMGYQTLEDYTDLYYMASQYFTPSAARGYDSMILHLGLNGH